MSNAIGFVDIGADELSEGFDADADGLPDWWEHLYFGDLSQTGSGDYDLDGVNNLTEFLQGRDPTVGAELGTSGAVELVLWSVLQ